MFSPAVPKDYGTGTCLLNIVVICGFHYLRGLPLYFSHFFYLHCFSYGFYIM